MNQNKIFTALFIALFCAASIHAQSGMVKKTAVATVNDVTETFQVLGNCGMCKRTIEKAAKTAGAIKAYWDEETDKLTVTFDPAKTSSDAVKKAVALAGYDNVGYKAPDAAYEALSACCHYDRSGAPSTAKSCTEEDLPKN